MTMENIVNKLVITFSASEWLALPPEEAKQYMDDHHSKKIVLIFSLA